MGLESIVSGTQTAKTCDGENNISYLQPSLFGCKNKAFSLVELVVSIGIITVLAGFLLTALSRSKKSATNTVCINNLSQIGIAMEYYKQDYNGFRPGPIKSDSLALIWDGVDDKERQNLGKLVQYTETAEVLYCPEANYYNKENENLGIHNFGKEGKNSQGSYSMRPTDHKGDRFDSFSSDQAQVIDYNMKIPEPPRTNHDSEMANILYFDRHVSSVKNKEDRLSRTLYNSMSDIWENADSQ